MKLNSYNRLSWALLLGTFVSLLITTLVNQDVMRILFVHSSYYFISAIVIVWICFSANFLKVIEFNFFNFIREYWIGILAAFFLVMFVFLSVKPAFRVLSDEANLVAISKSMAFNKTVYNTTMGMWYYDIYWPINSEVPKRPLLFPFGVHILHVFLGYSHYNAFFFNGIVLFALFISVFIVAKKLKDNYFGIGMMFLVISQPIITLNATSAGFDLFSTLFLWIVFLSYYLFIKKPTNANFALLWVNLLFFSNIRYESFIFHIVLILILVGFRIVKKSHWQAYSKLYLATPILYLPLIWQFILKPNSRGNPDGVDLFSVKHFFQNLIEFGKGVVDFRLFLPYATVYNLIVLSILIIIPIKIYLNKSFENKYFIKNILSIVGVIAILNLVIVLSHYFGRYTHPSSARLFLVYILALSLTPLVIYKLFPNFSSKWFLLFAATIFVIYHPIAIEGRFINTQELIRETNEIYRFLNKKKEIRFVAIMDRPGHQSIMNQGAVNFDYANRNLKTLLKNLDNRLIDEIYIIQKFGFMPQKHLLKDYEVDEQIDLKKVHEFQNRSDQLIRISKIQKSE
jgi:hypothetical protein